ncbi:MAG: thioredoxin family protein, partial [Pirellulaceae bacterium]|nr:thioredoxin family protein [Pirellulaceae bacterium]
MQGNIRSFLVNSDVAKASRSFICIRLLTYENQEEYKFMEGILGVRAGTLPNTVFCILAPDGKTKLTRSGRGPFQAFSNASVMASGLDRIAARYPMAEKNTFSDHQLPLVHKV